MKRKNIQIVLISLVITVLLWFLLGGKTTPTVNETTLQNDTTLLQTTTQGPFTSTTIKQHAGVITSTSKPGEKIVFEPNRFQIDPNARVCAKGQWVIVRMYSNSTCKECVWVREIFDEVVKEWEEKGRIHPIRWDVDTGDNNYTTEVEESIPASDRKLFRMYSPEMEIPTFILGCKYYRVGSGYYEILDRASEKRDLEDAIREIVRQYEKDTRIVSRIDVDPPKIMDYATTSSLFTTSTSTSTTTTSSSTTSSTSTSTTTTTTTIQTAGLTTIIPHIPQITPMF